MASKSQYVPFLLEELEYDAQFLAIQRLLYIHEQDRKLLHDEIEEMRELADNSSGDANWMAADELAGLYHKSCYQDAAHSMAAVGMIAPFIESVFQHAFPAESERILYGRKYRRRSLDEKVMTLIGEVGIGDRMPGALKLTLSALFTYRNKMFHHGFEWPRKELDKFEKTLQASNWPRDWFDKAESGEQPWMFYMSTRFVDHCLGVIEQITSGIEGFDLERTRCEEVT